MKYNSVKMIKKSLNNFLLGITNQGKTIQSAIHLNLNNCLLRREDNSVSYAFIS